MRTIHLHICLLLVLVAGCSETAIVQVVETEGSSKLQAQPEVEAPTKTKALEIVDQRMSAYNAHDIDQFMGLYSDDIEVFTYPDKSLGKGKKHLRGLFQPMFEEGKVSVKIHGQFAKDSFVVNHETVDYGNMKTEYVSIYEVRNGLIQSVRFVRD